MRQTKGLRVIALILGFAVINFGCGTGKEQIADFTDTGISAEAVPEGICVVFSNFSNIPSEIDLLTISFVEKNGIEEPDWENNDPLAIMNSISQTHISQNWEKGIYPSILEQVRKNGTVIFPFVEKGRTYSITAVFANNRLPIPENIVKTLETECVAAGGICLDRNITLNLNNAGTGVALSDKPSFTTDVRYQKIQYAILVHKGDYTVSTGTYTDDLFWDFEPRFGEQLREEGVANGNYPAVVVASLHIIHKNKSWLIPIDISPVFTYSL